RRGDEVAEEVLDYPAVVLDAPYPPSLARADGGGLLCLALGDPHALARGGCGLLLGGGLLGSALERHQAVPVGLHRRRPGLHRKAVARADDLVPTELGQYLVALRPQLFELLAARPPVVVGVEALPHLGRQAAVGVVASL